MYNKKNLDAFNLNMSTVLEFIYRNPQTSRIEIAHSTGITPATITSIVGELLDKNLIIESKCPGIAMPAPIILEVSNVSQAVLIISIIN